VVPATGIKDFPIPSTVETLSNSVQQGFRHLPDNPILKTKHVNPLRLQICGSFGIMCSRDRPGMRLAIELHGQLFPGAVKIQNVGADRMLTPKFPAIQLARFQVSPQARFGWRHCHAQFFPSGK
jgi:hypothetical protein